MSQIINMLDTAQRLANNAGKPYVLQADGDRLVVRRFRPELSEYLEKVNPGGSLSGDHSAEHSGGEGLRGGLQRMEVMP